MKKFFIYLLGTLCATTISFNATADDAEIKKYCEDAALVMQLPPEKAAAYIQDCIEARKAEMDEDR